MTPSAYEATCLACSALETPRPTATGKSVTFRMRETSSPAALDTELRAPVTPIKLAA